MASSRRWKQAAICMIVGLTYLAIFVKWQLTESSASIGAYSCHWFYFSPNCFLFIKFGTLGLLILASIQECWVSFFCHMVYRPPCKHRFHISIFLKCWWRNAIICFQNYNYLSFCNKLFHVCKHKFHKEIFFYPLLTTGNRIRRSDSQHFFLHFLWLSPPSHDINVLKGLIDTFLTYIVVGQTRIFNSSRIVLDGHCK